MSENAAVNHGECAVRVSDAASGTELLALRGLKGFARGVAFSPDGARIVSASLDFTVGVRIG